MRRLMLWRVMVAMWLLAQTRHSAAFAYTIPIVSTMKGLQPSLLRSSASSTTTTPTTALYNTGITTDQVQLDAEIAMQELVRFYQDKSYSPRLLQTKEEVSDFFFDNTDARNPTIDTILFDCDGVLYRSPNAVPGARECIQRLLRANNSTLQPRVMFVTNNAGTNRQQLVDKLTSILQLSQKDSLKPEMMVSSSYSCAQYIRTNLEKTPGSSKLFVIGSIGLCEELRQESGIQDIWRIDDDEPHAMSREEMAFISSNSNEESDSSLNEVDAVVVGHDTAFSFRKLTVATNLLRCNPHAPLIATNLDAFDLVGTNGYHIPGNGALVRSIEYASGRTAINVGKPSATLFQILVSQYGIDPKRSVIVGDRLDTDIRFGVENGMHSALVLTGVSKVSQLKALEDGTSQEPLPSIIFPHVGWMT